MRMGHGDVAPDHHLRELGFGHVANRGATRDAAIAQHDDPVADIEHFRQLVADEHDPFAFRAQAAKDREEIGDLGRREVGGRLVEDQKFRITQRRLQDFDALAPPKRQARDHRVGLKVESEALAHFAHARGDLGALQDAARARPAQHDVLDYAHRFDQHEMLVDHRDAGRHRFGGPVAGERAAAKNDFARVRRRHAEQHFHQGALARAVLAEQAEDLARSHFEIDAVVRAHGAEAADDPSHFQKRGHQMSRLAGSATGKAAPARMRFAPACCFDLVSRQLPLRASLSVGVILRAPVLNCAAMSSSSFTTASGTTGLKALPSAYCSEAPVTGAVS